MKHRTIRARAPKSNRSGSIQPLCHSASLEPLEERQMFSQSPTPNGSDPWVPYASLTAQDQAVSQYPFLDGTTVRVAVIDRGIDYTDPLLGGSIAPNKTVVGGFNFRDNNTQLLDDYGHGTTVAGIIAGGGYTFSGAYNQGIAPVTQILDLKQESSAGVKQALDWVIANAAAYNIQVVDLTDFDSDITPGAYDPTLYTNELQTLHDMGVFIVTPVGNGELTDGPGAPLIAPAGNANVTSVAGLDQSQNVWDDSRRGTGTDLVAPGSLVTALEYVPNNSSTGFDAFDDNYDGTTQLTGSQSGTSWAAAYVAGAATLLKQLDRTLTPDQIKQILVSTGNQTPDGAPVDGITSYPRLNIDAAITQAYQVADDQNHTNYSMKRAAPVTFKRGSAILAGAKLLIGKEDVWSVTIPDTRTIYVKTTYAGPTKLPLVNLINSRGVAVGPVNSRGLTVTVGPGTYYLYFDPTQSLVGTYGFSLTTLAVGSTGVRRATAMPATAFATGQVSAAAASSDAVYSDDDTVLSKTSSSVFAG